MSDCGHNCGSCGESCGERTMAEGFEVQANPFSEIKKVIAVVSGKGGVGKSMVTSLLSVIMNRREETVAILDADITGPSIPKAFGLKNKAVGTEMGIMPVETTTGIRTMSVNSLLEDDTDPVVWRGPVIAGTVKQFFTDVVWGEVDYMFIDMPPGTGDVPLTVFQSLPVDGIIVVTSPQDLVSMIVGKAVKMAKLMGVPVIGLVENMSYYECPDCGKRHSIFGESRLEEVAKEYGIENIARLPINPKLAAACDKGMIEMFDGDWLDEMADAIENAEFAKKIAVPVEEGEIFQHFGHTETFEIFQVAEGRIVGSDLVPAPGEGHSALAGFLADNGVKVLICGGIGGGAKNALAEAGIEVLAGVSGSPEEAVEGYLAGSLEATGEATCTHHDQDHGEGHSCGGHHHGEGHSCGGHSCGHSCH